MKQFSVCNDDKKLHDLENVKLKLKMISKTSKSSKVSVDDYISNILGTGLTISKPNFNKIESQSAQNLRSDRNKVLNGNEFNNSSANISPNFSSFTGNMNDSDLLSNLPFAYREIINKVKYPNGELDTQQIYQIFISSGLNTEILGSVWSIINRTSPGKLTVLEFSVGLAMVALYQERSFTNGTVSNFIPLTWDQVISRGKFPVPRLSGDKPDPLNDIDLSNIHLPNDNTMKQTSPIDNISVNSDNWADFSSFVSFDRELPAIVETNKVKLDVTPQPIVEFENIKQSCEIQKQINNQFSSWENDIKLESPYLNVSSSNIDNQSFKPVVTSKLSDCPTILKNGDSNDLPLAMNKSNVDSDFGDFQIFSLDKPAISNDTLNPIPQKTIVTDRYQIFKSELKDPQNNLIDQWLRCLSQCQNIIADTVKVLNKITDQSVKVDVFNSEKGILLLTGIIEVYRVTRNIKLSTSKANILSTSTSLVEVFTNIEKYWNDFMLLLPDEMQIDVQTRLSRGLHKYDLNYSQGETLLSSDCCGVCLCVLNPDDGFLSHGLRRYHCPCANLWVNTLDLTLPGLLCDFL